MPVPCLNKTRRIHHNQFILFHSIHYFLKCQCPDFFLKHEIAIHLVFAKTCCFNGDAWSFRLQRSVKTIKCRPGRWPDCLSYQFTDRIILQVDDDIITRIIIWEVAPLCEAIFFLSFFRLQSNILYQKDEYCAVSNRPLPG